MGRRPELIEGTTGKTLFLVLLIGWVSLSMPHIAGANEAQRPPSENGAFVGVSTSSEFPGVGNRMAQDTLDLEAHGGYTNDYVFGMTKAVMRSTLAPAVKPMALIFTVPLDLATLPFALVGGLFR